MLPASTLPIAGVPRLYAAVRVTVPVFATRLRRAILRWQERRFERDLRRSLSGLDDRTLRDLVFEPCQPPRSTTLLDDPTRMPLVCLEGCVWMRFDR